MSLFDHHTWWPLDLSPRELASIEALHERLADAPTVPDADGVATVATLLEHQMAAHVDALVERDGLPHLCHVINGWGDAPYRGRRLSDHMAPFLHRDPDGRPFVLQVDPEGEFHPWQSFAYAVMAGVDPHRPLGASDVDLATLARGSRYLNTDQGRELGHLLFALAHLDPDPDGRPFSLQGRERTVRDLMDDAVHAHVYGSFVVCRKFHLTEGLCAMAVLVDGLDAYREPAQAFLDGQLDMLLPVAVILDQAEQHLAGGEALAADSVAEELRDTLVIGPYLENHAYYAGHALELAAFADILGYDISARRRAVIAFVVDALNRLLPPALPAVSFLDCFLHLGHYRRAITLWTELERDRAAGRRPDRATLRRYTADFETPGDRSWPPEDTAALGPDPTARGVFALEVPSADPRPGFVAAVEAYGRRAAPGLEPRGHFDHFRRVLPPGWPRAVHYELLDYGGEVGAEIHLETEAVAALAPRVEALVDPVATGFRERGFRERGLRDRGLGDRVRVEWDPDWWRQRGRLRVVFPADAPAETVGAGLAALIDLTLPALDEAARALAVAPETQPALVAAPPDQIRV